MMVDRRWYQRGCYLYKESRHRVHDFGNLFVIFGLLFLVLGMVVKGICETDGHSHRCLEGTVFCLKTG